MQLSSAIAALAKISFPAFVHGADELLVPRTMRALAAVGGSAHGELLDIPNLANALASATVNVALAEAGVWFPHQRRVPDFPAAGEWAAAGAWLGDHPATRAWGKALAGSGGDLDRLRW